MERVQAKLVEEVAGDGDRRGVAHKRHRKHKGPKKEERTKKHKGPKEEERTKPKGPKEEERTKQHKGPKEEEERTKKPKGHKKEERTKQHKGDEAMKLKGDEVMAKGGKRRKTKLVTLRSPLPLEDVLIDELIEYMVCEPLKAHTEGDFSDVVFDEYFDPSISELYKVKREFDANVIQQYRINGYADIQFTVNDEEEVNDDEELTYKQVNDEEELTYELEAV
ncbi:hypothetical protein SETIT_3G403400v2 [Setaria italica]|uniref:Uncharacterized protein n=1 Tax=Setaria italica TaxID=4555 RepID=A0A368QNW5_SETIT|nr:hypothetical protein SETIT_3G403400v2 [Setaria italica]